jgi:uncharacterized membrane-anchored protein YitT (DUF2179 family)
MKKYKDFIISTIGITGLALSIDIFSWQFKLISSGLPGYALIVNYLTGFSVGGMLFIANSIVLITAFFYCG